MKLTFALGLVYEKNTVLEVYTEKRSLWIFPFAEKMKSYTKKGFRIARRMLERVDFVHAECWMLIVDCWYEKFLHEVTKCPQSMCNCFDIVYFGKQIAVQIW